MLEHYVPETMTSMVGNLDVLRRELIRAHFSKYGMETEKAEHDFIVLAQSLPHYGGHFYTATWVSIFLSAFQNLINFFYRL